MSLAAKRKTYHRGIHSEKIAALWLKLKGYKILERRYKTAVGEIDLIAQRNDLIVFVEVKARTTISQALESITPTMKRRIENTAKYYLAHHNTAGKAMRFDVIAVLPLTLSHIRRGEFFIHHLDNAWQATA